jgi:hypothetical protein
MVHAACAISNDPSRSYLRLRLITHGECSAVVALSDRSPPPVTLAAKCDLANSETSDGAVAHGSRRCRCARRCVVICDEGRDRWLPGSGRWGVAVRPRRRAASCAVIPGNGVATDPGLVPVPGVVGLLSRNNRESAGCCFGECLVGAGSAGGACDGASRRSTARNSRSIAVRCGAAPLGLPDAVGVLLVRNAVDVSDVVVLKAGTGYGQKRFNRSLGIRTCRSWALRLRKSIGSMGGSCA